jgi:pyruvate dehydrogenase E2 component (dihydrolipoyllysine-residue acetyltransferase)
MPINILMPALSPTMEKGNLAKWLKKEGEAVKTGDVIAEIETDKATMEYEAVDDGVMAKIVVPEGTQDVPVHQLIAVMAQGARTQRPRRQQQPRQGRALRRRKRRLAPAPHPHLPQGGRGPPRKPLRLRLLLKRASRKLNLAN